MDSTQRKFKINGFFTSHSRQEIAFLVKTCADNNTSLFIELGTYGALPIILNNFVDLFVGIDRKEPKNTRFMEFHKADAHNISTIKMVKKYIDDTNGTVHIHCDDGNKKKEMTNYAPLLRKGDLISVHDVASPESKAMKWAQQVPITHMQRVALENDLKYEGEAVGGGLWLWRKT
jgi:hypothetical protein